MSLRFTEISEASIHEDRGRSFFRKVCGVPLHSVNCITVSVVIRRQVSTRESSGHESLPLFSPFQKPSLVTRRNFSCFLNKVAKWYFVYSLPCFINCPSCLIIRPSITQRQTSRSHQNKSLWQKGDFVWPFRTKPNSGRSILTTDTCCVMERMYLNLSVSGYTASCSRIQHPPTHCPGNIKTLITSCFILIPPQKNCNQLQHSFE